MRKDTVIAANRFGLGARPGDLEKIDKDPKSWLLNQLQGSSGSPDEIERLPTTASVLADVQAVRQIRRDAGRLANDQPAPDIVREYKAVIRRHYLDQSIARFRVAAQTDSPFHERLVHFWGNHFAVSADKQPLTALAGLFEKDAIRPFVSGKFVDMLMAVEKHPAMILYLDNQRSIGPNSELGKRANRRRNRQVGLNENLAREILELHTLGVSGGYDQEDVTTFAKVITGWSIGGGEDSRLREGTPGTFEFRQSIHEPGPKTLLGKTYQQSGIAQGEAVLSDLARHPATARFIATKLSRHFVADDPPQVLIDEIAATFIDSDGHLPTVHAALVNAKHVWRETHMKYKTPQEFVISAYRAFDRVPEDAKLVVGALDLMGQTPYRPGSPAGWPDTAEAWGGADGLYKRIEWSNTVARLAGNQVNPIELAESALGSALAEHTRAAISRAESFDQGVTLFLVSPEFQRR